MSFFAKFRSWNHKRLRTRSKKRDGTYKYSLAVLGIMKDESMNIDEWMSHYLAVGAEKIYLIDNGSTDQTVAKAQVWVEKGLLELIVRPQPYRQVAHYSAAVRRFNIIKTCKWLLIADLDEFWFCPDGASLAQKLEIFDDIDVIYANWRMFGSSGMQEHPKSIREKLVHCDPSLNIHGFTKYIVRTSALRKRRSIGVHKVRGADSRKVVSDNHNFHLNHYPIQSRDFFQSSKMQRGDVFWPQSNNVRDWEYYARFDAPCTQENRVLADLVISGRLGKAD